jgi:carboxylesterase type B
VVVTINYRLNIFGFLGACALGAALFPAPPWRAA